MPDQFLPGFTIDLSIRRMPQITSVSTPQPPRPPRMDALGLTFEVRPDVPGAGAAVLRFAGVGGSAPVQVLRSQLAAALERVDAAIRNGTPVDVALALGDALSAGDGC